MAKKDGGAPSAGMPICFRLTNEALATELTSQAKAAGKPSPALFARDLVEAALVRPDELVQQLARLTSQLRAIDETLEQVKLLREDLASSVNLLLVKAGQLAPAESHKWVENTLLRNS